MRCGLLGRKLSHSYSPHIHKFLGDYEYALFEKEPEEVESFLRYGNFDAINVTIPYKKTVIPFCNSLSSRAKALGAVNTIVRQRDGSLLGHNTDFYGFEYMLRRSGASVQGKKALILGSGGASVTASAVLQQMGAQVIVISRTGTDNYTNLDRHADASVIVNATPVGMYPNLGQSPVDLTMFPNLACVLDMVYNPARTELLMQAERLNIPNDNGLWMLVAQAKESAEWFTGEKLPDELIPMIHRKLKLQMENIVLIGMPGCGKTTIGRELAKRLDMSYTDTDDEIIKAAGCPIPQIFQERTEAGFRKVETEAIAKVCAGSGMVIATGGGCVTVAENYPHLHQNGQIFWLKRDLSLLPTDGRPLSQAGMLADMYKIREPLYRQFCDHCIDNNGTEDETISAILSVLEGGNAQ
ncbi:MAG: shikimate kinase [Oscillospiraceae bacterium]|nr:shikimate kinase [Oscillospiraceae bacterium]